MSARQRHLCIPPAMSGDGMPKLCCQGWSIRTTQLLASDGAALIVASCEAVAHHQLPHPQFGISNLLQSDILQLLNYALVPGLMETTCIECHRQTPRRNLLIKEQADAGQVSSNTGCRFQHVLVCFAFRRRSTAPC
ncbi:hypothetical protein D3C76_1315290 [compost metagenome]